MVFFCHMLLTRVPPQYVSLCRSPEMIFHGHPWLLKYVRPGSPLNEEPRPTLLYLSICCYSVTRYWTLGFSGIQLLGTASSGFGGRRGGGHVILPPTPRHASDCPPLCNILFDWIFVYIFLENIVARGRCTFRNMAPPPLTSKVCSRRKACKPLYIGWRSAYNDS